MRRTLKWQLYVSGYRLLFGLLLLAVPNEVIPLLGFKVTGEPWVRLAGMFLLCLLQRPCRRPRQVSLGG